MNPYERELRNKWNSISYLHGGYLQLGVNHPLEWHVGYFSPNAKAVVIVTDEPAENLESSKSIQVFCNLRKDGRYAISLTLTAQDEEDVFVTMCGDMISFSADSSNQKEALLLLLKRYAAWHKLLQRRSNAMLSEAEQKGLIGELLYLKDRIERDMDVLTALAGWVGPEGADQDFVYTDGWHELKTTGAASAEITISSVEQLNNPDDGELVVTRIDKCSPAHAGAFTLYGLVHQVISMINSIPTAKEILIQKLAVAGYIDIKDYDQQSFVFSSRQKYIVNSSFPRFLRDSIPAEVVNLKYTLSLPSLAAWKK